MKPHNSYDAVHLTMWLAAVFCMVYVSILFYYLIMPISHWVTWTDVYPTEDEVKVGSVIMYVSDIEQHRMTNYKFIDTMFCRDINSDVFIRHGQQTIENYAEEPAENRLKYPFPFSKPVMYPGICYLNSTLIITTPVGILKAVKFDGKKREHFVEVVGND